MAKGDVYQRKKMNTKDGTVKYYYVKVVNDKSVRISKETFDQATKRRTKKGGKWVTPGTQWVFPITNVNGYFSTSGWVRITTEKRPILQEVINKLLKQYDINDENDFTTEIIKQKINEYNTRRYFPIVDFEKSTKAYYAGMFKVRVYDDMDYDEYSLAAFFDIRNKKIIFEDRSKTKEEVKEEARKEAEEAAKGEQNPYYRGM